MFRKTLRYYVVSETMGQILDSSAYASKSLACQRQTIAQHCFALSSAFTVTLLLLNIQPGLAATFDYVTIANLSTPIPDGTGNFLNFTSPSLSGGNVAFQGWGAGQQGIYKEVNGLSVVADLNTIIPGGVGNFTNFASPSLSGSNVAFLGYGAGQGGVYDDIDELSVVADTFTPNPATFGVTYFAASGFGPPTLDGNYVAFKGEDDLFNEAIYTNIDGLGFVADENTLIPGSSSLFVDFFTPSFSHNDVAFGATGSSGEVGFYSDIGGLNVIADLNTPIPDGTGNFGGFVASISLSNGNVAFEAFGAGQNGIYKDIDGLGAVADLNTPIPGGSGSFSGFSSPSISDGSVAFEGTGSGQKGIYLDSGGLSVVADLNTPIPSGSGNFTEFYGSKLDGGNVIFEGRGSDGQEGIYVAFQQHTWEVSTSGNWETDSNWIFDTLPRDIVETVIQPNSGVTITGPSIPTQLKALTINTVYNGIAELHTQTSGQLTIGDSLTIGARGKLVLEGVVTASEITNQGEVELVGGGQLISAQTIATNSGVISGNGLYSGQAMINSGQIRVGNGQYLRFSGTSFENNGQIEAIGGTLPAEVEFTTSLHNNSGVIFGRDATMRFQGGLINDSSMAISFGTTDVFGDIANSVSGTIAVAGNSQATFYDDVVNSGVLNVFAGSTTVFFGALTGNGNVGSGDVQALGDLSPGFSPGAMKFFGDLELGPSTHVLIELGGALEGDFDQVQVTGEIVLNGNLDIQLSGGFVPNAGDSFEIVNGGSLLGSFDSITLPSLPGDLLWFVNQTATSLELVSTYAADFDEDGDVDDDDLAAWDGGFGSGVATHMTGDANFSATANGFDFLAWQRQRGYGESLSGIASSVPEPSMLILAILCIAGAAGYRPHRRFIR